MSVFLLILYAFIGAVLYRVGGSDLKVPFKTKFRDFGVPFIGIVYLVGSLKIVSIGGYSVALGAYFLLSFGSMTTYWDKWGTDDVEWYEWTLTGFCYGASAFPIAIYTGKWLGFALRTAILTIAIPFSNKLKYEFLVESFRGFVFIITLPLLVV